MLDLAAYEISPERGFLAAFDPERVDLPGELRPLAAFALELPKRLVTGRIRAQMRELPDLDLTAFCKSAPHAQVRKAFVHYGFLVQAYVWGETDPPERIPRSLARPIWQLADAVGQPPLLTYSAYVLDNWGRIYPEGPIDLTNTWMVQHFLGGQDEAWFVLIHVAIEAQAGAALAEIPALLSSVTTEDLAGAEKSLENIAAVWDTLNAVFARMTERCDPYIYFTRVRPWIHGWKDNPLLKRGLVYEGVAEAGKAPQTFRGQTGSQSSIVPAMDALLGIGHGNDPLRTFLDELHHYRPPGHRKFIEDVRKASTVRAFVERTESQPLRDAYNACILGLAKFRTRHLDYAASYINKQARDSQGNASDVGTGGTPFMKYLKKHRDEAEAHLL